ncbi:murein L,D-transpeptidase catalytic domain family protein [Paraflavisolibacter sp. H34]|uniref:murein L,D-transpeptidase catalytic domain family protein n=1 Tax=Huijunlia imazamoxiresistens TaxID=3127457 RepID=UPI00301AC278
MHHTAAPAAPATIDSSSVAAEEHTAGNESFSSKLYSKMKLEAAGLSRDVLEAALKGYEKMVGKGLVRNEQYLTIIDFSQSSRKKRFYLLDLKNMELALNTFVSHGKNSGLDRAAYFSNTPESEKSSLGFYVTKGTYTGKHGKSLRLSGLEQGFNDKAEARGIVVHAADYVNEGRVQTPYMGRSQGCPALSPAVAPRVINMIKDGSALFIYHPTASYLNGSKMLNS